VLGPMARIADAGPPGMLLNILTHASDGGSSQYNCLLILTHFRFNIQIINSARKQVVSPMRGRANWC